MLKVLLVQKNKKNNMLIRKALEKKRDELEIIEISIIGENILERIQMLMPDIVLVSSEIQGETVLWLLNKIKEKKEFEHLHIIVATKTVDNDYVRKVFRRGASDCLFEPLNEIAVVESVENLMEMILAKKIKSIHSKAYERKMTDCNIVSEYAFFYDLMFNENSKSSLETIRRVMNVGNGGFIITFDMENDDSYEIDYFEMQKKIKYKLFNKVEFNIGPVLHGRMCVYVHSEEGGGDDSVKTRNRLHWTAKEIYDLILQEGVDRLRAGVGRVYPIEKIGESYEESLRALAENKKDEVNVYKEKVADDKECITQYEEKVSKLVESIELGNSECFTMFEELLSYTEQLDEEEKYNRIVLLLTLVTYTVGSRFSYETEAKYYVEEFKKNFKLKKEDINIWATKRFNSILKGEKYTAGRKYSEFVKYCIEYIYDNYKERIELKDMAIKCNISVQYLSKVFREEVGVNFVDFLNKFRIKKAKEMMQHNKMSIKEICFEVGYNDPNYFSRIFKKLTGKTPRKYISEHIN